MNKKKKEDLISIIMACYNGEKYIEKALDSVFNQTYKNFELICVNDGSTDTTLDILNKYKKKHSNMKVYTKQNEGGKGTPIYGIKRCSGDYVCVIDNDDYLDKNYLKNLYNTIKIDDSDMSVGGYVRQDYNTGKIYSTEMNNYEGVYNLKDDYGLILRINTATWNKMFKRSVTDALFNFQLDADFMGDMTLMAAMYSAINKISFTKEIVYFYQVRSTSVINSIRIKSLDNIYDNLIRIKDYYEKNDKEKSYALDAFAFLHLGVSLMFKMHNTKETKFKNVLKKNKNILDKYFKTWRNNKYYSLFYVLKNKGANRNLHISHIFYKIGLFPFFISTYDFVITKLKIDIKW